MPAGQPVGRPERICYIYLECFRNTSQVRSTSQQLPNVQAMQSKELDQGCLSLNCIVRCSDMVLTYGTRLLKWLLVIMIGWLIAVVL